MTLGDLVKDYRTMHDLSQRQFALLCGLSNGYISILEKGLNPKTEKPITPTIPQLCKLAEGMGMTVNDLLEKIDDMPIDLGESAPALSRSTPDLTPDESELLRKYRALDDAAKGRIRNALDYEYNALPGNKTDSVPKQA